MRMDKGKPFTHVEADSMDAPTFSERFLYETVGKDEARFILGVADEYEHVINALGPSAVRAILDVKPQLVQRLGTGEKIVEWLEDARDWESLNRSEQFPEQVILDDNAAEAIWRILHDEYRNYYEPEKSMDSNHLRTYLMLTERLGHWEKEQKEEADKEKPGMIARRDAELAIKKRRRKAEREFKDAALNVEPGSERFEEALSEYREAMNAKPTYPTGPRTTTGEPYKKPEGCTCKHHATNTGWMYHREGCKYYTA